LLIVVALFTEYVWWAAGATLGVVAIIMRTVSQVCRVPLFFSLHVHHLVAQVRHFELRVAGGGAAPRFVRSAAAVFDTPLHLYLFCDLLMTLLLLLLLFLFLLLLLLLVRQYLAACRAELGWESDDWLGLFRLQRWPTFLHKFVDFYLGLRQMQTILGNGCD